MDPKFKFETVKKDAPQNPMAAKPVDDRGAIQEVDETLAAAAEIGAKEVHFDPLVDKLVVRQRLKEGLVFVKDIEERLKSNVVNRVKVLSGMDITKNRIPQTGYMKLTAGEQKIEIYTSVSPAIYGEKLTVKFQYRQESQFKIETLGFAQKTLALFKKAIERPNGLILISGPPGSGKRTTAYACLNHLNAVQKLLLSIDSMIKYEIPGMVQVKRDDKCEFKFSDGVRSVMEQEPDVCYIGEMNDPEVARLAVQGGFSRRIVLGRMSANNSVNAIQSIIDMGVPPFLVIGSLIASLNQRLVRRLCSACKSPYEPSPALIAELGMRFAPGTQLFKAVGCAQCENRGYQGQIALFELYLPNEELAEMFISRAPVKDILKRAAEVSLVPLKFEGAQKAASGFVAIEDVLNAI
jgi:type II secretory ATPase GspE/PulE/Tfp pilus assembly ATPase PilB-like protein